MHQCRTVAQLVIILMIGVGVVAPVCLYRANTCHAMSSDSMLAALSSSATAGRSPATWLCSMGMTRKVILISTMLFMAPFGEYRMVNLFPTAASSSGQKQFVESGRNVSCLLYLQHYS